MSDPVNETPPGSVETTPEAQPDSPVGNEGVSAEGLMPTDRSEQNARGELLRKQDRLEKQVKELVKGMQALTQHLGAQSQQQAAQPSPYAGQAGNYQQFDRGAPVSRFGAPSGNRLAEFSDDQLQASLQDPNVNAYQREVVRQELADRRQDRRLDQMFQQRERDQYVNSLKQQSEQKAYEAFPALRDPESEFSRRVEAELVQQRRMLGEHPLDKFNIANQIARVMGVEMSSRTAVPGYVAPASSDRPTDRQEQPESVLSPDEINKLAKRFASAMPVDYDKEGRPVRRKFDTKKLTQASQEYGKAKHAFRGKGIRVSE